MEDIIDIIVTETTNLIEITSQPTDEIIDVNIIDNREDVTLNVTPTLVEININSLTGNFGILWGEIEGTLSNQTDLQNALNLKADLVDGKVPSSQLPSYVDDVVEVATYSALPATGETGKIYVVLDTNLIYRWSGSAYIEIKDSSAVWGAITGTLSNQTDLQNALNAKANDNAVVHLAGTETITGAKTFSSAVTAPNFVLSGGTGNTGLYYGHTDRVVLANYTAGGIDFEVNGGSIVATLFPSGNYGLGITIDAGYKLDVNGTARISGALSGTSASFSSSITASSIIKSGGTSSQFLKADGSVDSNTYLTTSAAASTYVSGSGTTNYLPRWSSSKVLTDSFVYTNGNYTEIQGQGLTASMGIVVSGRYGSVANAPKIYSSDETTGVAHIELVNGGGEIRLGVEKSTGGQILPGSSAYATVLTAGLSGRNLEFGTNNTKRMTIDGSTGAVTLTGALSGISATFSKANISGIIDNNAYLRLVNTGTSTLNQSIDLVMRWQDGTYNGTGGISMVRESATARSGKLILQPIDSSGNNVSALTLASTGAATFSSSVTATELYLSTSNGLVGNINSSNANGGYLTWQTSGTTIADIGTLAQIFGSGGSTNFGINARGTRDLAFGTNNTERFRITSGGFVGIGTTSPASALHVVGESRVYTGSNLGYWGVDNGNSYVYLGTNSTGFSLSLQTSGTERMRITNGGDLIFTGQSSSKIQFYNSYSGSPANVGLALFNTSGTTVIALNANGGGIYTASLGTGLVYSSGGSLTSTNPSDSRLKKNIKSISYGLADIMKLRPVSYDWKEDKINQGIQFGFIAQEVQEVMPDAIKEFGEETKFLGLEKDAIYATLVNAVKELKAELDTLKNK